VIGFQCEVAQRTPTYGWWQPVKLGHATGIVTLAIVLAVAGCMTTGELTPQQKAAATAELDCFRRAASHLDDRTQAVKRKPACAGAAEEDREILALRADFQRLQAMIDPLKKRHDPLQTAFYAIGKLNGFEGADKWAKESGFWAVNDEIADLNERAGILVERMILLRPKTPGGIAAVAASIKEDQTHFW
jgi:hypothetical protein